MTTSLPNRIATVSFLVLASILLVGCTPKQQTTPIEKPQQEMEAVPTVVIDSVSGETQEVHPVTTEFSYTATKDCQTAIDLLRSNVDVSTKDYDFGTFIEEINGVPAKDGQYWAFYVNREYAQQGVDTTTLKPGDTITFRLESIDSSAVKENQQ